MSRTMAFSRLKRCMTRKSEAKADVVALVNGIGRDRHGTRIGDAQALGDAVAHRVAASPGHAVPVQPLGNADELAEHIPQLAEARPLL